MSLRQTLWISVAFAAMLHLAGCDRRPKPPAVPATADAPPQQAPAPVPRGQAGSAPAVPAPDGPSVQAVPPASVIAPEAVLKRWAAAIEARDWAQVRALWGNHGADSGLSPSAFAARWRHLAHPLVTLGSGQQEGAAGSSYYTAPVRIEDGGRIVAAAITLRRVNNVPGASAEQLRWHFGPTVRAPWTDPR